MEGCVEEWSVVVSAGSVGGHGWEMQLLWSIQTRAKASWWADPEAVRAVCPHRASKSQGPRVCEMSEDCEWMNCPLICSMVAWC
jgi:hypothetical protein